MKTIHRVSPFNQYMDRLDGIRSRFLAVTDRRLQRLNGSAQTMLALKCIEAALEPRLISDDLLAWTRAGRVLGGVM